MTLNREKVKVHVLFKETKNDEKTGRTHIHVSRSTVFLFDSDTPAVWRVCMKFYDL